MVEIDVHQAIVCVTIDSEDMPDIRDLLTTSTSFLLIDWPDRDVPDTLARHGFRVVAHDGPGPNEYNAYEMADGQVRVRETGQAPDRIDIVYTYRPIDELAAIVKQATDLYARAVWVQSGLDDRGIKNPRGCWLPSHDSARAKQLVEGADMIYVESPYLPDAVREAVRF
jgi:hypothetical protein